MTKEKKKIVSIGMSNKNRSFKLLFVDISKQFKESNEQSIWLLIGIIGCWGIPYVIIQFIAMCLVFIFAIYKSNLLHNQIKNNFSRFKLIKKSYGQYLTGSRRKLFNRKMRQLAIPTIGIYVLCNLFLVISFYLISKKAGIGFIKVLYNPDTRDKILEFFLQM